MDSPRELKLSEKIWTVGEPYTSRRAARLRFLEKEVEQLKSYREELEKSLRLNKQVLADLIGSKAVSASNTLDLSEDTEVSSVIPFRTFEQLLTDSCRLQQQLKEIMRERDITQSRALITEQIAEEARRKEREAVGELEEQLNELKVLLEKKEQRARILDKRIKEMSQELQDLKEGQSIMLPLNEDNLAIHKQLENLKRGIALATRDLHKSELCRQDYEKNIRSLACQSELFESLLKLNLFRPRNRVKPMKRENGLDVTFDCYLGNGLHSDDSESDSEEQILPDKFAIKSTTKPKLPKLDFSKLQVRPVSAQINKMSLEANKELRLKAREAELERKVKAKNDELAELRRLVAEQEEKNTKLAAQFKLKQGKPKVDKPKKRQRRRCLSDLTSYLMAQEERQTEDHSASARLEKDELDLVSNRSFEEGGNPAEMSSFIGSEVAKMDYEEPDSVFVDYLDQINI
mmetsp:Transcript_11062/g.21655  ORF Transcript_11062/g.21655 Transcript_11062/m.21655 type:complete len:461 (+) Transcript_11062:60-1442(+)